MSREAGLTLRCPVCPPCRRKKVVFWLERFLLATAIASASSGESFEKRRHLRRKRTSHKKHHRHSKGHTRGDICSKGCPLNVSHPICSNGVVFQNPCILACQKIGSKLTEGNQCEESSAFGWNIFEQMEVESGAIEGRSIENEEVVEITAQFEKMNRFVEKDFVFMGSLLPVVDRPSFDSTLNSTTLDYVSNLSGSARITSTGELYVSGEAARKQTLSRKSSTDPTHKETGVPIQIIENMPSRPTEPNLADDLNVGLQQEKHELTFDENRAEEFSFGETFFQMETVLGLDTRMHIADTFGLPYKLIGEFDYRGNGEGGCSGAIVGKSSVLTAAHCVYSHKWRRYYPVDTFAPGRYRHINGTTIEPFGRWVVDYADIFPAYVSSGSSRLDIAIVSIKPNSDGEFIGNKVGNLSLAEAPCVIDDQAEISGYPSDKPNGEQWSSGWCDAWQHQCNSMQRTRGLILHRCDTFSAQSGAPMVNRNHEVFGVHTSGGFQWNLGVPLSDVLLSSLMQWMK